MLRVFKVKWFAKYMRKAKLTDAMLCDAVERAENGLIDADLGGEVIKQRVARKGQGRSGGYRVLIAFRSRTRSVFVYAFAKNERDNIDSEEFGDAARIGRHLADHGRAGIGRSPAGRTNRGGDL